MRCYYEVLGVERQVSLDDLKKAYKRLALKWHPDKNPDTVEEATVVFREIQQAYEVLSDPQERAWYDKNRERILQGGFGRNESYVEERFDVFRFFTASCYTGFTDAEDGFYAVYRNVFSEISEEEQRASLDPTETAPPSFGSSESCYDEVVHPFYEFWESFSSCKSFAWKDEYDSSQGPNRFVRRKMEAENKKLRDSARKERNEEVRELVAFVKKRDPRVIAYRKQLKERAEVNAKKARDMQDRALRRNMEQIANFQESDWCSMNTLEDELTRLEAELDDHRGKTVGDEKEKLGQSSEGLEDNYDDDDSDDELGIMCEACNKVFRSEKAFRNHEQSKRHRDNIRRLTEQLKEDGFDFLSEDVEETSSTLSPKKDAGTSKKSKKKRKQCEKEEAMNNDSMKEVGAINGKADEQETTEISNEAIAAPSQENAGDVTDDPKSDVGLSANTSDSVRSQHRNTERCSMCQSEFSSRNKLFAHLKETGHALRTVPENSKQTKKKKRKN